MIIRKSAISCETGGFGRIEIKDVSAFDGKIGGYASIWNEVDLGRDIVLKGAFADSLSQRGGAKGVRMLYQHDPNEVVGVWDSLVEDEKGLRVDGHLIDTARRRDLKSLLSSGAIDGLSIGFKTVKSRFDTTKKARLIEKAQLWEISIVTFPLLETARVGAMKSFDPRELETALRDAGLSRTDSVKAVGVLRGLQREADGETEDGQRDAAATLMNNLRRLDSMFG